MEFKEYTECPSCLVSIASDATINQLARLLQRCAMMLDDSLCPHIDHQEAFAWIEERRTLLEEIRRVLDANDTNESEEVC